MTTTIKKFLEWIGLKEKIHTAIHKPPLFKEGEVWWCYTGENIGVEMNGKGDQFTRPVLVFKKYDKYSFLSLPLSTKPKSGSWYVSVAFGGRNQTVVLMQGRMFDYRRFKEKIGTLADGEMERVREGYAGLHFNHLKNRPLAVSDESRG